MTKRKPPPKRTTAPPPRPVQRYQRAAHIGAVQYDIRCGPDYMQPATIDIATARGRARAMADARGLPATLRRHDMTARGWCVTDTININPETAK